MFDLKPSKLPPQRSQSLCAAECPEALMCFKRLVGGALRAQSRAQSEEPRKRALFVDFARLDTSVDRLRDLQCTVDTDDDWVSRTFHNVHLRVLALV